MENVRGHLSLGFGRVLGDLAEIGYDTEWQVIPAAAVGAPHKRDRVFIVAYPNSQGWQGRIWTQKISEAFSRSNNSGTNEGWSNKWIAEPDVGRVANGIPDRVDRLKGLGNAIVPQVAELVGALVLEHSYN